jgi:hypothetical protein
MSTRSDARSVASLVLSNTPSSASICADATLARCPNVALMRQAEGCRGFSLTCAAPFSGMRNLLDPRGSCAGLSCYSKVLLPYQNAGRRLRELKLW